MRREHLIEMAPLAFLAILPLTSPVLLSPFYIDLATKILILGIALLGYDILAGYTGLVSFGHGMFFGLGAYTVALLLLNFTQSIWLALMAAVALTTFIAFVVAFLSIRTRGIYFVLLTMAFAQFFYLAVYNWVSLTGGSNGLGGIPKTSLFSVDLGSVTSFYYFTLIFLVASYYLCKRIVNSPLGKVLEAIRENEERAEFIGYDVKRFKRRAFVISGFFSGLAGALFGHYQSYVSPDLFHWSFSGQFIIMTWLGGVGTLVGPVLGGAVLIYLGDLISSLTERWLIFMGIIYVIFVLFSPKGIVGLVRCSWR